MYATKWKIVGNKPDCLMYLQVQKRNHALGKYVMRPKGTVWSKKQMSQILWDCPFKALKAPMAAAPFRLVENAHFWRGEEWRVSPFFEEGCEGWVHCALSCTNLGGVAQPVGTPATVPPSNVSYWEKHFHLKVRGRAGQRLVLKICYLLA